jgi:hypothetical protein
MLRALAMRSSSSRTWFFSGSSCWWASRNERSIWFRSAPRAARSWFDTVAPSGGIRKHKTGVGALSPRAPHKLCLNLCAARGTIGQGSDIGSGAALGTPSARSALALGLSSTRGRSQQRQTGSERLHATVLHELERLRRPDRAEGLAHLQEPITSDVQDPGAALHRLLRPPRRARVLTGQGQAPRSGRQRPQGPQRVKGVPGSPARRRRPSARPLKAVP